jgi:hypothetical protein
MTKAAIELDHKLAALLEHLELVCRRAHRILGEPNTFPDLCCGRCVTAAQVISPAKAVE